MTPGRTPGAGLGWSGAAALVGCGIALGYSGYFWAAAPPGEPGGADAHGGAEDEHAANSAATVSIPAPVRAANGVVVRPAETRVFQTPLTVPGTVAADQTRIAHIRPLSRGVVDQVFVRLGDHVSSGDPLVSYDNENLGVVIGEYRAAHAGLQSSLTTLEVDATILSRSGEMLEIQAIARTEYDVVEAAPQGFARSR